MREVVSPSIVVKLHKLRAVKRAQTHRMASCIPQPTLQRMVNLATSAPLAAPIRRLVYVGHAFERIECHKPRASSLSLATRSKVSVLHLIRY